MWWLWALVSVAMTFRSNWRSTLNSNGTSFKSGNIDWAGGSPPSLRALISICIFARRNDGNAQSKQSRINGICAWSKEHQRYSVEYSENAAEVTGVWTNQQDGDGR